MTEEEEKEVKVFVPHDTRMLIYDPELTGDTYV